MAHITGDKVRGGHTTVIPAAYLIARFLMERNAVKGISPGRISHKASCGGGKICKITIQSKRQLVLVIVQQRSIQRFRVYTTNGQSVAEALARFLAERNDYEVKFGRHHQG